MSTPASDDEEYEYDASPPPYSHKKKRNPPAEPRKLMRWNPDVDQLTLLCIDYVCTSKGIGLPWDDIGKEIEPFLSGEGVKQHLGKLRLARVASGRKVPPKPEKGARRKSKKKEDEDEGENEETAKKLAPLLYHGPEMQKKAKTPKRAKPATPAGTGDGGEEDSAKSGRKRAKSTLNRDMLLGPAGSAETPTKKSTGKRGRKPKVEKLKEEDAEAEDHEPETPSKRQKTYGLRAVTKEPNYTETGYDSEDLLAEQDQGMEEEEGDEDYVDDTEGGAAKKNNLDDSKDEKAPPRKDSDSDSSMPPPPPQPQFNFQQQAMGASPYSSPYGPANSGPQVPFYHGHGQPMVQPPTWSGLLQANTIPNFRNYGDHGNLNHAGNMQDPFGTYMNAPHTPPSRGMEWSGPSMMPRPEESALRSSANMTLQTTQKDEAAAQAREKKTPRNTRKETAKKDKKSAEKKDGQSTNGAQPATPVPKRATESQVSVSPANTADANNMNQASIGMSGDVHMNNYSHGWENTGLGAHMRGGANGFDHHGTANFDMMNGTGNGNFNIGSDGTATINGVNFVTSPDTYGQSNGMEFHNMNFDMNSQGVVNTMPGYGGVGGLPSVSPQQTSQGMGLTHVNSHSGSFDSTGTIQGSQTDEAKTMPGVNNGDESQNGVSDFQMPDMPHGMGYDPTFGGTTDVLADLFPHDNVWY